MTPARALAVLLLALAGCLGAVGGPAPGTSSAGSVSSETYVFDHASPGPAIEGGIGYPTEGSEPLPFYVTVVATDDEASRFDPAVLASDAEQFIEGTDFDREFLVVVEAFPASSEPDYRVERLEWKDDGLHLAIDDSSDGGTTDVTVETLLVRVDRGGQEAPENVTVTTEEGETFPNSEES